MNDVTWWYVSSFISFLMYQIGIIKSDTDHKQDFDGPLLHRVTLVRMSVRIIVFPRRCCNGIKKYIDCQRLKSLKRSGGLVLCSETRLSTLLWPFISQLTLLRKSEFFLWGYDAWATIHNNTVLPAAVTVVHFQAHSAPFCSLDWTVTWFCPQLCLR